MFESHNPYHSHPHPHPRPILKARHTSPTSPTTPRASTSVYAARAPSPTQAYAYGYGYGAPPSSPYSSPASSGYGTPTSSYSTSSSTSFSTSSSYGNSYSLASSTSTITSYTPATYTQPTPPPPPAPRPTVHFPPAPVLARVHSAHSAASYDRSPIAVAPNACALPARGCPGRTYDSEVRCKDKDGKGAKKLLFGDRSTRSSSTSGSEPVPALIPDLSSESDESDGQAVPTLDMMGMGMPVAVKGVRMEMLPHAGGGGLSMGVSVEDDGDERRHRRRSPSSSPPKQRKSGTPAPAKRKAYPVATSGFGSSALDDGILGGF